MGKEARHVLVRFALVDVIPASNALREDVELLVEEGGRGWRVPIQNGTQWLQHYCWAVVIIANAR